MFLPCNEAHPGAKPNHTIAQIFCLSYAIAQSLKNSDFSRKDAKIGRKTCFSRNHAHFLNEFTQSRVFFDVLTHNTRESSHDITQK